MWTARRGPLTFKDEQRGQGAGGESLKGLRSHQRGKTHAHSETRANGLKSETGLAVRSLVGGQTAAALRLSFPFWERSVTLHPPPGGAME